MVTHHCRDAEEAEALACLEGLKFADHWPNQIRVELETDYANIVMKIQRNTRDCSVLLAIVGFIKEGMTRRRACQIQKIWRDHNRIAHNLAHYALKSRCSRVSFSFVPLCIQDLVYNDRFRCQNLVEVT
jgi:hypothetical protein